MCCITLLFVMSASLASTRADNLSLNIDNSHTQILFNRFNDTFYEANDRNLSLDIVNGTSVNNERVDREERQQNLAPHDIENNNNNNNTESIVQADNYFQHFDNNSLLYEYSGSLFQTSEVKNDELIDNEEKEIGIEDVTVCHPYNLSFIIRDTENLTKLMKNNKISDLIPIPRINLTNCVFKKSTLVIVCELIANAYDYRPFINYDTFMRIIMTFKIIRNDIESEVKSDGCYENMCLVRFTRIWVERVGHKYNGGHNNKIDLGPTFMIYFLRGLEKLNWEIYFSAEVAVGILYMNPTCSRYERTNTSCISRVEIINFPQILGYRLYAYCTEFWEAFKMVVLRTLGGHDSSLNLISQSKEGQYFVLYMTHILNGTELTSLTLKNFNVANAKATIDNMPLLKYLDISNNNINLRNTDFLKQTPNVEYLDISSNKLESIPQQITLLRNLKYLDISRNPIKYIDSQSNNVLSKLIHLKWLLLSHIRLNSLGKLQDLLKNDNSTILLQGLDVSYCNLSSIEDSEFYKQQNQLQIINLGGNNISFIPPKLFLNFKHLKKIGISNLNLTQAPKLEFGCETTMEFIDLSNNRLTSPEDIILSGRVTHLDLSFNLIKDWSDEAIFSLTTCCEEMYPKCNSTMPPDLWVQNLNLSYNLMPIITKTMAATLTNLETVDIGANPFSCSHCDIQEFGKWVRQVENHLFKVNVLSLSEKNNLKCKVNGNVNDTFLRDIWSVPAACVPMNYWMIVGSVVGVFLLLCLLIAVMVVRYKFEMAYVMFMLKQKRKSKSMECKDGFQYDAFVCYSHHDRSWVMQEMVPTLEECIERYRLCLHERDFILGSFISLNIIQSILKSRFTVLVLSKGFIQSQWCRWELEIANYKLFESGREFLILIELERLKEGTVPRHLKFLMDTRTYLEWPETGEDTGNAWKRLIKTLGKSIHQEELDATELSVSTETIF